MDCKARIVKRILHAKWWISRIFCSFLLGICTERLPNFPSTQFETCKSQKYNRNTLDMNTRLLKYTKYQCFQRNKIGNLTNSSLNLSHNLIIGDGLSCFIICNYLWLLINFLKKTQQYSCQPFPIY